MSQLKVNAIRHTGASSDAITLASDGKATYAATSGTSNFTISDGDLVIGTSGHGIDFSATSGSGTSELLADYEEGSYTPSVDAWSGETVDFGYYVKVGRLVNVWGGVEDPSSTSSGNAVEISLPFTPSSNTHGMGGAGGFMSENVNLSGGNETVVYVKPGVAELRLYHITDSGWNTVNGNHCGSTSLIWYHVTYYV